MPIITRQPTANESPDTGQGGLAVTGAANTGHDSTTSTATSGSETKTCRWSGFQAVSGQIISVKLKFDWTENGSLNGESSFFRTQYTINGGSSWTTIFEHTDINAANSGSSEVTLSNSQNLTQVQMRDFLQAISLTNEVSVTGEISNIRLEVTTVDANIIVMM